MQSRGRIKVLLFISVVLLAYLVFSIEKGGLFVLMVRSQLEHLEPILKEHQFKKFKLEKLHGGLISGISLEKLQCKLLPIKKEITLNVEEIQSDITWLELALAQMLPIYPAQVKVIAPYLSITYLKGKKDNIPRRGFIDFLRDLSPENIYTFFQGSYFKQKVLKNIENLELRKGTFFLHLKKNKDPLNLNNLLIDFSQTFPSKDKSNWGKLNYFLEKGYPPPSQRAYQKNLTISGSINNKLPFMVSLKKDLRRKASSYQFKTPLAKSALIFEFINQKGWVEVLTSLGTLLAIEGSLHLNSSKKLVFHGLLKKLSLKDSDIPESRRFFPFNRLHRLRKNILKSWSNVDLSMVYEKGLLKADLLSFVGQERFIGKLRWKVAEKELFFQARLIDRLEWKGSYSFAKHEFDSKILFRDLPLTDFLALPNEVLQLDLSGLTNGFILLYGPLRSISLEGELTTGKGYYQSIPFQESRFVFKGTGRYCYLDEENSKIFQEKGMLQPQGYVDFKNPNIFQNISFTPLKSVETQNWTLKTSESEAPTIDRKIIKGVDLEFKGTDDQENTGEVPSVKVKIQKKIKF